MGKHKGKDPCLSITIINMYTSSGIIVMSIYLLQICLVFDEIHRPECVHKVIGLVDQNLHGSPSVWPTQISHTALTGVTTVHILILERNKRIFEWQVKISWVHVYTPNFSCENLTAYGKFKHVYMYKQTCTCTSKCAQCNNLLIWAVLTCNDCYACHCISLCKADCWEFAYM